MIAIGHKNVLDFLYDLQLQTFYIPWAVIIV